MYLWLVFVHLIGLVVFLMSHGASMWVAFRLRQVRDRATISALLDLSNRATQASYVGLLLLGIGGLGAAYVNTLLTAGWIVASYVVVVIVLVAMYAIATPYYMGLRKALGTPGQDRGARGEARSLEPVPPIDDAELARRLDSRRPDALAGIGGLGLVVLVWLMVLKPF
jgi:hypothetical protein